VRSGVLTSVHAFATDPARGVFILLILCLFIGGSFFVYAWRASARSRADCSRRSRARARWCSTTCSHHGLRHRLHPTLYPALEVCAGDKISVGAPFFNLTFGPLFTCR
jgi:cytochrome c-type biogenesis protein CcmF